MRPGGPYPWLCRYGRRTQPWLSASCCIMPQLHHASRILQRRQAMMPACSCATSTSASASAGTMQARHLARYPPGPAHVKHARPPDRHHPARPPGTCPAWPRHHPAWPRHLAGTLSRASAMQGAVSKLRHPTGHVPCLLASAAMRIGHASAAMAPCAIRMARHNLAASCPAASSSGTAMAPSCYPWP
jgi:hypothetical protein